MSEYHFCPYCSARLLSDPALQAHLKNACSNKKNRDDRDFERHTTEAKGLTT